MLHTPTLMLSNVLITVTLAVCMGLVGRRDRPDGLFYWGLGLTAHSAAYVLYMLRGQVSDLLSVVLANMLLSAVFSLLQMGAYQFQGRRAPLLWVWLPVPLVGVLFVLLLDQIHARVVVQALVMCLQFAQFVRVMAGRWSATFGVGKFLLLGGFGLITVVLVLRVLGVWAGVLVLQSVTDSQLQQTVMFGAASIAMVLVSFGIVLMAKERAEEHNRVLALEDALTGLHNRRSMQQSLEQMMAQAQRTHQPLAVLLLDIDHFKRINDTHGHPSGDKVLKEVAACLRSRLRAQDLVGRWGGEEFMVVLPHTDAAGAQVAAQGLCTAVASGHFQATSGAVVPVTISLGVHVYHPANDADSSAVVSITDSALYRAKAGGRNCVEVA